MGSVVELELEEPNKLVPEGATICLKHYLTGPNSQETRDALEKEEDVHSIIKIVKAGEHFNIDGRFGQIKHVVEECFETNYLQNHKLCYLRASARATTRVIINDLGHYDVLFFKKSSFNYVSISNIVGRYLGHYNEC